MMYVPDFMDHVVYANSCDWEGNVESRFKDLMAGYRLECELGPVYWRRGPWADDISLGIERDAEAYERWIAENPDTTKTWQECQGSNMGRPKR
jgi:hypothetical protein